MARTFDPWVGPLYETEGLDGLKLFVLGESHYGTFETESKDFTQRVVRSQGRGKHYRLFTITAKLILGRHPGGISDKERASLWDRIAFANYIQSFVTETAESRDRPTEEMWERAAEPFLWTLEELKPDALLILGIDLSRRLPSLPLGLKTCATQHPSRFLKYANWQPKVQHFLLSARAA